jgi:hypothetical protein
LPFTAPIIGAVKKRKTATSRIKSKIICAKILEVDEFWTYVGNKKNKVWLIYAYHRATGEIVSYV